MVLKNLVRYIINKFLKTYIEELDYEKVKLDLKNGQVCLEQLHLKPESLVDLGLPVTVATGYLEKLTLIIPWKNLSQHPTKVYIDGLLMLIVPKNEVPRDFTGYYDDKMRRVQRKVDNLRKAALNTEKLNEKETTFVERMRLQIMRNLEITIRNLHISYETISTTKLGHPFSFGLTIAYLEMMTTTNNQTMGKIKEHSLVIFKMKEMHALSLYWNTKCKSRINMSFDDVVEDLKSKIATNTSMPNSDEMNYLLHPINLTINLTITLQLAEYNFERPAYNVEIEISELNLNIDPKQFSDLLDFIKFQNYSKLYDRCREYRELQFRQAPESTQLTSDEQERIRYLECKLDVFNLAYIRHSVEIEIKSLKHQQHDSQSTASGTVSSKVTSANSEKWHHALWKPKSRSKENERPKSSVSMSMNSNGDILSEDSPNIDIKIKVNKLGLNLTLPKVRLENNEILIPIQITDIQMDFKRQAVSSNILFTTDLQSLSIFGMQAYTQSRPLLVTGTFKSSLPLIHMELEFFPLDKKSDYRLYLIIEPLKVAYDAPTVNQIVQCFDPNDDNLESTVLEIKRRTLEEMERDLTQEKVFDMTLQLKGMSLLFPENGVLSKCSSTVYIYFDNLILISAFDNDRDERKLSAISRKALPFAQEDMKYFTFYRKYQLKLANVRIIYSQSDTLPKDKLRFIPFQRHMLQSIRLQRHILRSIPLLEMNFYKCIYTDDANLADWRITATIEQLTQLELSTSVLIKVMQLVKSVPLFASSMTEALRRVNLYFTIFPPHTTVEVDLSIQRCFLILRKLRASILTDISSHISKTRDVDQNQKTMELTLENLTMARRRQLPIKAGTSGLFYQNQSIKLLYQED